MADKDWIQKAIKNKGSLRKELGVKDGKKIPAKELEKATHSKDEKLKKRAVLAKTLRKFS